MLVTRGRCRGGEGEGEGEGDGGGLEGRRRFRRRRRKKLNNFNNNLFFASLVRWTSCRQDNISHDLGQVLDHGVI